MKSQKYITILLLASGMHTFCTQIAPFSTNEQDKINIIDGPPSVEMKKLLDSLSSKEKADLIEKVKKSEVSEMDKMSVLVRLGDDSAISTEATTFRGDPWNIGDLFDSTQPKTITATAGDMFLNQPLRLGGGDVWVYPVSYRTAIGIRDSLTKSLYFSGAVKKWASSWDNRSPVELRDEFRKWWLANREYFVKGDYASVKPGDPAPPSALSIWLRNHPGGVLSPRPWPAATVTASPQKSASANSGKAQPRNNYWYVIVSLIAAGTVIITIFKGRINRRAKNGVAS